MFAAVIYSYVMCLPQAQRTLQHFCLLHSKGCLATGQNSKPPQQLHALSAV